MTILETASVQVAEHDLSVLTPTDLEPRIGAVQQLDARPSSPPWAEDRNLRREVLKRNVEPTAVCKKRLRGVSDLKCFETLWTDGHHHGAVVCAEEMLVRQIRLPHEFCSLLPRENEG